MNKRLGTREPFEILEMEIQLLADETDGNENIGRIKAVPLMLEDKVNELYRRIKWKRKSYEKSEILESRTEICVCGQPWVYEDTFFGRVFGRCMDEYCIMNVKRDFEKEKLTRTVQILRIFFNTYRIFLPCRLIF